MVRWRCSGWRRNCCSSQSRRRRDRPRSAIPASGAGRRAAARRGVRSGCAEQPGVARQHRRRLGRAERIEVDGEIAGGPVVQQPAAEAAAPATAGWRWRCWSSRPAPPPPGRRSAAASATGCRPARRRAASVARATRQRRSQTPRSSRSSGMAARGNPSASDLYTTPCVFNLRSCGQDRYRSRAIRHRTADPHDQHGAGRTHAIGGALPARLQRAGERRVGGDAQPRGGTLHAVRRGAPRAGGQAPAQRGLAERAAEPVRHPQRRPSAPRRGVRADGHASRAASRRPAAPRSPASGRTGSGRAAASGPRHRRRWCCAPPCR